MKRKPIGNAKSLGIAFDPSHVRSVSTLPFTTRRTPVSKMLFSTDVKKASPRQLREFVRVLGSQKRLSEHAAERLEISRQRLRRIAANSKRK